MTRARDLANLIGSGNFTTETLTATAGQTAFTPSNTFTSNFLLVFYNGLLLDPTVDYTENGTTITLTVPATAGDEMEVVTYNTFSVGDAITQTEADNRYVNAAGDTMTGTLKLPDDTAMIRRASNAEWVMGFDATNNILSIGTQGGSTANRLQLCSGGNKIAIEADGSGRVLTPYRPVISVGHNGTSQALTGPVNVFHPSTSGLSVLYDTNVGGMLNESTGRFTVPVAGNYEVSFFTIKNGAGVSYYNIAVNGYDWLRPYSDNQATGWSTLSATGIVALNANDYITVVLQSRSASNNAHGSQHLRFTIKHLG